MRTALPNQNSEQLLPKGQPEAEAQLLSRCQKGDTNAQYQLYSRYRDWVFNVAFKMTNNQQEAEDISQKVFMRIFKNIGSFRGDSALSSWIYRIAVNVSINHARSQKKHKAVISDEDNHGRSRLSTATGVGASFDLAPHLESAIRSLPRGYRMVFILHDVEGYNHQEIANMMNISDGTSKSQLHKARKELKQLLEPVLMMRDKI